jgi:HEAT repeat protein
LLVPSCLFAIQTILGTGSPALQYAQSIAKRLTERTDLPADLHACRLIPEVRELREAIFEEAAPVLPFLQHQSPQVRVIVLTALEFRKTWRMGQPDVVLRLAQTDREPIIRAAALLALGSVQHRTLIEAMAECLRDPVSDVRRAAAEALLWDTDRRWVWIRHALHQALGDPRFAKDGPLTVATGSFHAQAVADLMAWATESGTLGVRATLTLVDHYSRQLSEQPDPMQIAQLRDQVANPRASAVLRVELAGLLHKRGLLNDELLDQMLHPTNPSSLRLLAVEALLQQRRNEQAIAVLREVARQPNRELSLTAAIMVQKYLHFDMGLELGAPPPPLHSRQAAEVTHRMIQWAQAAGSSSSPASTVATKVVIDW